jgi:mannose-1-phosphate guanylyltransferase
MSREAMPKQLLRVVRGKSLLRLSFERLAGMIPVDRIYVCTLAAHRDAVLKELPELKPDNLLGEPQGRDTANAVGLSAAVLHQRDPDAMFTVVTADHVIEPVEEFRECIRKGFAAASRHPGSLVTFGIVPTFAHTGLGYIQRGDGLDGSDGPFRVLAFVEKPDKPTADKFVESGRYYWNSGMFVWKAATVLERLEEYLPLSAAGLKQIAHAWDTPGRDQVLSEVYPNLQKISVDYAVMEPASRRSSTVDAPSGVLVVEMPINWLDVGSWPTLSETLETDDAGNAVDASRLVMLDCDNNIVLSQDPNHLVTMIGLNDLIVVRTRDATLICPKSEAQRVKELVGKVKEQFGKAYI